MECPRRRAIVDVPLENADRVVGAGSFHFEDEADETGVLRELILNGIMWFDRIGRSVPKRKSLGIYISCFDNKF